MCVLDWIGAALDSHESFPYKIIADLIKEVNDSWKSTVIRSSKKISCLNSSFVNGAISYVQEIDDGHMGGPGYPRVLTILPALLVGEERRVNTKDFILSIL